MILLETCVWVERRVTRTSFTVIYCPVPSSHNLRAAHNAVHQLLPLAHHMQILVEAFGSVFQTGPLAWTASTRTRRGTTDAPSGQNLEDPPAVSEVGARVFCYFVVDDVAVHNGRLHQPEEHLSPPLPCFPLEGIVHRKLICSIHTVHVGCYCTGEQQMAFVWEGCRSSAMARLPRRLTILCSA